MTEMLASVVMLPVIILGDDIDAGICSNAVWGDDFDAGIYSNVVWGDDFDAGICSNVVWGDDFDADICSNAVWDDDFDDNKPVFGDTCDDDVLVGDNVDSCVLAPFV
jgi:hypothetical protein